MVMDLPLITIPAPGLHTHTVIFLHEAGRTARNLASNLHNATDSQWQSIIEEYPSVRWVFPQAPSPGVPFRSAMRYPSIGNVGIRRSRFMNMPPPKWFDEGENDNGERLAQSLRETVLSLRRVLESEAAMLRGRWDRIVLGGISQGAGAALHTLVNLKIPHQDGDNPGTARRLGGFVGVSCMMPFAGRSLADTRGVLQLEDTPGEDEVVRSTPFLLEHFLHGGEVSAENGMAFRESVIGFGVEARWREYDNQDGWPFIHSPNGVDDIKVFFADKLDLRPN